MRVHWYKILFVMLIVTLVGSGWTWSSSPWGFFGHRLINRTAVFTLPVELIPLYKSNIDYVTEHSIDPDKRRHASPLEAIRHYIDIDHWGNDPFDAVPTTLEKAMVKFGTIEILDQEEIIVSLTGDSIWQQFPDSLRSILGSLLAQERMRFLDEGVLELPSGWIPKSIGQPTSNLQLQFREDFTSFGILPYHLKSDYSRLVYSFRDKDWVKVLRLSAEIGHYIADAHVPLHTTENYNGQMTGQNGIHAFWESRIPELFANEEYDLFTGRAKIIEDTDAFFWNIVKDSHMLVDEVLGVEMELRETFDRDQQYCNEVRGASVVRQPCEAFAKAYQDRMQGMVEDRMREAIAAVGSVWYSAWVQAGRPELSSNSDLIQLPEIAIPIEDGEHELIKSQ